MSANNSVNIIGRLTADPELRQTSNGTATCKITVAINRSYKDNSGERQADFISVTAWKQTAEFISRYFTKGQMIAIEGELRSYSYTDKRYPDVTHFATEVTANNVAFCGEKQSNTQERPQTNGNGSYNAHQQQQGNYTPPQQTSPHSAPQTAYTPNLNDFDEVISDGDLPF